MEVFNFLNFWKPNVSETESSLQDGEERDESLFDLNIIASPAYGHKNGGGPKNRATKQSNGVNSNRKILPLEYSFRPQSPIALLKSAPKFSLFASRNQKATEPEKSQDEESRDLPIHFYRERRSSVGQIWTAKQILMKLLYPKLPRKYVETSLNTDKIPSSSSPSRASVSSPVTEKLGNIPASVRQACRHLRKSKSTSDSTTKSVEYRKERPFLQYEDAIESAILHCKRSFNSSHDSSNAHRRRG